MRIFLSVSLILNIMITLVFANSIEGYSDKLKRDPFLPLLDAAGREKADSELVRSAEVNLPLNISLKGIIWSKTSPLVVINDKIFREGDLVFEGLILEKINPGSIILNNRGERIEIVVRKKEKKEVRPKLTEQSERKFDGRTYPPPLLETAAELRMVGLKRR